jgi:hypothetical protein
MVVSGQDPFLWNCAFAFRSRVWPFFIWHMEAQTQDTIPLAQKMAWRRLWEILLRPVAPSAPSSSPVCDLVQEQESKEQSMAEVETDV